MAKRRRRSYYDSYWPRYEPAQPIEVKDGIKAKSARGQFVQHWWGDRWIKALTPLMDSGRLGRGRSYARRGQVMAIHIAPGHVTARVQGTRPRPYEVTIDLEPLGDPQWDQVFDALAKQAIFAAQLLNGEMPADIEQIFDAVCVPLFPTSRGDLQTDCSCPDWANPCKHIAAVYYLLGERFDEDPFLLLELRGRDRESVFAALRERRADRPTEVAEPPTAGDFLEAVASPDLEGCLGSFWDLGAPLEQLTLCIAPPQVGMALLKRLGCPPFVGEGYFRPQMERVYDGVAAQALQVAFASPEGR